jgi:translation initiation factor IF-3
LEKGHKVKAYVQFRGRELAFKDKGELVLLRLAEKIGEIGKVDTLPMMNNKKMIMTISPKAKK